MAERYSRDTVVLTTAEINELVANKALDPTVEYWVDRNKFAYAPTKEAVEYLVSGDGNYVIGSSGIAASVTGTTVETILASFTIPAGKMGVNTALEITHLWSVTNNANAKNVKIKIGATVVFQNALPSMLSSQTLTVLHARNSLQSQVSFANSSNSGVGSSSAAPSTYAIDFSVDQTVTFTCALANAADSAALEMFAARVAG